MTTAPGNGKTGDSKAVPKIQSRDLPRNWVPRPRLDVLLDRATAGPLTLLVAPAGSGKSVMLRGWVARSPPPVRSFAGSAGDRLRARRGARPAEALAEVGPGHGRAPQQLLVVDDAHLLSAVELGLIVHGLQARPRSLHVILATRRDLALPLVSLKLSDSLAEIRADQLFTDDEADALITAHAPGSSEMDVITVRDAVGVGRLRWSSGHGRSAAPPTGSPRATPWR